MKLSKGPSFNILFQKKWVEKSKITISIIDVIIIMVR